ncbi:hypothetical protein AYO21_12103 [Fonsecaea monophora]|uniref:Uncharacterized protein n=1 Tax=Fonsecaea monophora TaxID=254056 RepID=A0A177EP97_9EURO|nr:hypothetical protein AYO21_12103 [Fonsecaea monophora]OAG33803.1 hypothetical protein AYO21_12103 [Fonsecaea monophora]
MDILHTHLPPATRPRPLRGHPPYVWTIPTPTYFRFLRYYINRFALGFELVYARALPYATTWEQTKIMAMFLRYLRFALGGLEFHRDITDLVTFSNSTLRDLYVRRGGAVRNFFDYERRLDLALRLLEEHVDYFRIDTLYTVEYDILPDYVEEALQSPGPFYYEYFRRIISTKRIHTVTGNKSDFKDPRRLKPYRTLYRRAYTRLSYAPFAANHHRRYFTRTYIRYLFKWHWLLPYPHRHGLT